MTKIVKLAQLGTRMNLTVAKASRGQKALVCLTYDGTLPSHAEVALGHLSQAGLQATFFADPVPLLDYLPTWKEAVRDGHEVGNGCLLSSLTGGSLLAAWTPEMVADDIDESDSLIRELFPSQTTFTLGYPWVVGHDLGLEEVRRIVAARHAVCRSGVAGLNPRDTPDLGYLKCVHTEGMDAGQLAMLVQTAAQSGTWVVFAFDGVGEGDRGVDARAHRDFCHWLSQRGNEVDVLPVRDAAARSAIVTSPGLHLA